MKKFNEGNIADNQKIGKKLLKTYSEAVKSDVRLEKGGDYPVNNNLIKTCTCKRNSVLESIKKSLLNCEILLFSKLQTLLPRISTDTSLIQNSTEYQCVTEMNQFYFPRKIRKYYRF